MASKTVVEWVDDIDGGPAAETVTFALDGVEYEIDLSTEHAGQLRAALKEFIRKARSDKDVAEDEPSLMPAPAPVESGRHLPAPRSAIKSRIPADQLAMDVDVLDEPKPTRRKPAAAAKAPAKSTSAKTATATRPATAVEKASAEKAAAATKTAARKIQPEASTPSAKPAAAAKPTASAPANAATPATKTAPSASAPAAKPATPAPATKAAAASTPTPATSAPATSAPQPAPEPQRPAVASPFSQPAQPGVTQAKKDGPNRPPMITFSSAKPS